MYVNRAIISEILQLSNFHSWDLRKMKEMKWTYGRADIKLQLQSSVSMSLFSTVEQRFQRNLPVTTLCRHFRLNDKLTTQRFIILDRAGIGQPTGWCKVGFMQIINSNFHELWYKFINGLNSIALFVIY